MGEVNKKAAEDLVKYNPATWCRAFFSSRCKSDLVDNNICETFNSAILKARFKPIISMLDEIRTAADEAHKLFIQARKNASAKHEEFKMILSEIHVINKKFMNFLQI